MRSLIQVISLAALALMGLTLVPASFAAAPASAAVKIYRSTDSEGNPVFSDTVSKGAQPVDVSKTQTYPPGNYGQSAAGVPVQSTRPRFVYARLQIISPKNQTSIRNNAGNIEIDFKVTPGLIEGESLILLMDGQPLQHVRSSAPIPLTNVDRGTHTVQLQAINPDTGRVLQSSNAVTFTLHRHSILHKKPTM